MPRELNKTVLPLSEQAYSAEVGNGFRDLFRRKKARQLSHPASVNTEKKGKLFRYNRATVFCNVILSHCAVLFSYFIMGISITVDVPVHRFTV
mgnify:CR=1 FL=1